MNTGRIAMWADDDHWYQPWPFIIGWILVVVIESIQERLRTE